jgi:hypothetical protein
MFLGDTAIGVLDRLLSDPLSEARESEIVESVERVGIDSDFIRHHATMFSYISAERRVPKDHPLPRYSLTRDMRK